MMLSFITPTAYIKGYQDQSDFILALSHLIDLETENSYERAVKTTRLPILLDNGLFENHFPESAETLVLKAKKIGAHTAFCPDHLFDAKKTEEEIDKCFPFFEKHQIKMGAVVQADNREDYLALYDKMVADDRIDIIGLSILSIPKSYGGSITESRIKCLKDLQDRPSKKCHLLGLGSSLDDVIYASKHCSFVVSHDSSSAFWNAIQGKRIKEENGSVIVEGGKTPVEVDFSFDQATIEQITRVQDNINIIRKHTV